MYDEEALTQTGNRKSEKVPCSLADQKVELADGDDRKEDGEHNIGG